MYFNTTILEIFPLNSGQPLESTVPANSHLQLLRVFEQITGLEGISLEGIEAKVLVESGGSIYSYATIIDNDSGDPTAFVTATE